jgi:AraC-like DNA-binding protein
MKFSGTQLHFDWIVQSDQPTHEVDALQPDINWTPYPFPAELGSGGFEIQTLALGMSAFRARHEFNEKARGQIIPLAKIQISFDQPTLQIQSAKQGRLLHEESISACTLAFGKERDLFRYSTEYSVTPLLDTNEDSELVSLSISQSTLDNVIGQSLAAQLIEQLDLTPYPAVKVVKIPRQIQRPLHDCFCTAYTGALRKIEMQADALRYLAALTDFFTPPESAEQFSEQQPSRAKERAHTVRDYLCKMIGNPPSMNQLAVLFGRSSRMLNDEFSGVFGQSIFAFISEQRLNVAYEAICSTDIPLKVIAQRIGYSHVNHFSAAFSKRFGFPPSALRKSKSSVS